MFYGFEFCDESLPIIISGPILDQINEQCQVQCVVLVMDIAMANFYDLLLDVSLVGILWELVAITVSYGIPGPLRPGASFR